MQMRNAVHSAILDADVLVMSAAVADFRPAAPTAHKLKKETGTEGEEEAQTFDAQGGFSLYLVRNPDILGELAKALDGLDGQTMDEGGHSKRLVRVGFAAETNNIVSYARTKLVAKHLDLLVANDV